MGTSADDFSERFGLEHPLVQAGMAGGVAGGDLAGAVSAAGALGTVGMMAPGAFLAALRRARQLAPGRSVAANLLVLFIRPAHLAACREAGIRLIVLHGGLSRRWLGKLRQQGAAVFVTVGTTREALQAKAAGADGLVMQGSEAGGHLLGVAPLGEALDGVLEAADGTPVLAAGGVASAADVRRLIASGATGAVAGTRFLLTQESVAHPLYKQRLLDAESTLVTLLFGLGWPLRHRVIPNQATERWCRDSELGPRPARAAARLTAPLARRLPLAAMGTLAGWQRPSVPLFSPALPLVGMPDRIVESTALYAGESVGRIHDIVPAAEAVALLMSSEG